MPLIDIGTTNHPVLSELTTDTEAFKCMFQSYMGKDCKYTKGEYESFRTRLMDIYTIMSSFSPDKNTVRKMFLVDIYIKNLDAQLCIYDEYCNLASNLMPIIENFLPMMEQDLQNIIDLS